MTLLFLRRLALATAVLAGIAFDTAHAAAPLTIEGNHFVRDGKPYQIISGDIHFQRIPRAYWADRLRKAHAMGLNTITSYVFWNAIERQQGHFDFSGGNDVAAFVKLAQSEGLNVILRPGPYICGEWEAGGYPAWLFAEPGMRVRSRDPRFLEAASQYLKRLGQELAPLMSGKGGPIIATELENEYGSYNNDKVYLGRIRTMLEQAGLADDLLLTYDGPDELPNGTLPGVAAVIDFAPGEAKKSFATLAKFRPNAPRMVGEYWAGWFDQWGGKHAATDAGQQSEELAWMLGQGYSVNLYMFEGGSNFGFMNGANFQSGAADHYAPQTTSYDYDAALDEAGQPTAKFALFRDVIAKATGSRPPAIPTSPPPMAVPRFTLEESASLWDNLPAPIKADTPQSMETYGQSYGYILYRTEVQGPIHGELYLGDVRDYAAIYLDHQVQGTVDRRLKQVGLPLNIGAGKHVLDLLVENTGRINFGAHLEDGRAGIVDPVLLDGQRLHGWEVYPLPMSTPDILRGWTRKPVAGPAFHRGVFHLDHVADTFLDTRAFTKGFLWLNGQNLGRIWSIGPQYDLYAPGPWLRDGDNSVVVFDLETRTQPTMQGDAQRRWDASSKTK